jgi:hypothetical protein
LKTPDSGNLFRSIVCPIFILYVEGRGATGGFGLPSDIFPSEKPGIDGPGAWTDHRQRPSKGSQNDGYRFIANACHGDPHLYDSDQRSYCGSPQACQNEQPQQASN